MKKFTYGGGEKEAPKQSRTGFRIVVHESISRFPVTSAKITFLPGGRTVTTKARGTAMIDLEEGTYSYTVKAVNFPQLQGTAIAKTGIMQLLYIKLEKESATATGKSSRS
jgi:hypothetical protein